MKRKRGMDIPSTSGAGAGETDRSPTTSDQIHDNNPLPRVPALPQFQSSSTVADSSQSDVKGGETVNKIPQPFRPAALINLSNAIPDSDSSEGEGDGDHSKPPAPVPTIPQFQGLSTVADDPSHRDAKGGGEPVNQIPRFRPAALINLSNAIPDSDSSDEGEEVGDHTKPPAPVPTIPQFQGLNTVTDTSKSDAKVGEAVNQIPPQPFRPAALINLSNAIPDSDSSEGEGDGDHTAENKTHLSPAKSNLNNTKLLSHSGANSQIPNIPPPPSSPLAVYKGPFGEWCRFTSEKEKVGLYNRMSPGLQQYLRPILEDSVLVFNKAFVETRDFARQIELANRYNRERDIINQLRGKNDTAATRENELLRKQVAEVKGKAEELTGSYNTLFMKYQEECLSNKKLDYELTTVKVEHKKEVEDLELKIEELRNERKLFKGQCKKMSPQKVKKVPKNNEKSIFDESIDDDDNFMEVVEKVVAGSDLNLKNDKLESLMKEPVVSEDVQVEKEFKGSPNPKPKTTDRKFPVKSKESPYNTRKNKKITDDDEEVGVVSQEKLSIPSCISNSGVENPEAQNIKIINKSHEEEEEGGSFDGIFSPPRTRHHKSIVLTDDEKSVDSSIKGKNKNKSQRKNKAGQSSLPKSSVQHNSTLALSESENENEHELSKPEVPPLNISTPTKPTSTPTTKPTGTNKNDIYLSRKARREQILNESPVLIKRKVEDIRSISNKIINKSTPANANLSTNTKASKKSLLSLAEVKKCQPDQKDKQEIPSGIKRIQTRAQKVQVQTKKNKNEDQVVNDSIDQVVEQVIKESKIFQADPDAGLYENKSKKIRVSHHPGSTKKKDKKVESTLISVVPSSVSPLKKPKLGHKNGEEKGTKSGGEKLKLNNEITEISQQGPGPEAEVDNNINDEDISELEIEIDIVQDSTMSDQDASNISLEEPMVIDDNDELQQPKPTTTLVSSDKNKNKDLELEQGELSDNTIESPTEPVDPKDNPNETSPSKKWTVIGRSGVGQMSKRSQFIISKFMELPLDEIKNSDEILSMIKKNGDLPSKVNLATWINDYIISNGQERLAQARDNGPPLSITYGKIFQMVDVLREKMSDLYDELPSLLIEHFSTQLVPKSRNWNDDNLVNYGRLYGAICRKYFEAETDRGFNLLFQILYWSPPHAFSFAFGFLCSYSEILAHFTFDNLSIRGKAVSFALINPPRFFDARYYPSVASFVRKSIKFILPEMVFDQMVVTVLDALKQTEHDTTIREAGQTLAMLFMQCDWECFLKFIHENLSAVVKSWSDNQLTDAVLSAFIRMIGDVFHDSIEFKDVDKIQQAIEALTKLDAELRTPIIVEAIDTTILKIQAKRRLMNKEGAKEMPWEFKKMSKKGKKNDVKPKRKSLQKRRRQRLKREEKKRTEIGIRKRKKEMLRAADEFLAQDQEKVQDQVKTRSKVEKPSTSKDSIEQSPGQASKNRNAVKDQNNKNTPAAVEEKLTPPSMPVQEDLVKTRGKTRASSQVQDSKSISKVKLPDTSRNRLLKKVSKVLPISHPVKQHYQNKKAKLAKK